MRTALASGVVTVTRRGARRRLARLGLGGYGGFRLVGLVWVFVTAIWIDGAAAQVRLRPGAAQPPVRRGSIGLPSAASAASSRFAEPPPDENDEQGLRHRVGLERARQLLESPDMEERLRGIERLATMGTPEAATTLVDALAPGSAVRVNPMTRLAAVRALAPHAADAAVRSALLSVFLSGRTSAVELPVQGLARETAAMALARGGGRRAMAALAAAVAAGGASGQTARRAIVAHPPPSLRHILGAGKKPLPWRLVALLGELGDLRAIAPLRRQLDHKQAPVRAAAAVALARLGDGAVEPVARSWLEKKGASRRLALGAAEALQLLGLPAADGAIAALLASPKTRGAALSLAERAPSAALLPALQGIVEQSDRTKEVQRALRVVARVGNEVAARVLIDQLARAEVAIPAALGLARMPGQPARSGLRRALHGAAPGGARRLILRAGLVRYLELGETFEGLGDGLVQALRSSDAADRSVGSFGATLLGLRAPPELIRAEDVAVAAAAARGALFTSRRGTEPCWRLLRIADRALGQAGPGQAATPAPDPVVVGCGAALLTPGAPVSALTLARWAEAGGALAPAAAWALARRDPEPLRQRLRRLLDGTDPVVRAHVALGLGWSSRADAVSLLTRAYRFEIDPSVRRAQVRALSLRREPQRRATLELARSLDPDPEVRGIAHSALHGVRLAPRPLVAEGGAAWILVEPNDQAAAGAASLRPVRVVRRDGVAIAALTAPDGVLVVPGFGHLGRVPVLLAPQLPPRQSLRDGSHASIGPSATNDEQ